MIAAVYFLFVWLIQPIEIALRLDESSLIAAILAAAVAFLCFSAGQKPSLRNLIQVLDRTRQAARGKTVRINKFRAH